VRIGVAAALVPLFALAAVFGACRGGEHAASPTVAVTAEQTPPDVIEGAPTAARTPSSGIGPISQEEAFGKYLSASAFEIDLLTKQIYVYIGQRPPYMTVRAAEVPRLMNSGDRAWNAGAADEIVVSRNDSAPVPAYRSGPVYRIITPGQASWSPAGHILAFGSNVCGGGHLQLLDADSGAVRDVTPDVRGALGYAWSPDGGRLAFTYIPGRDFCEQFPRPTRFERLP
jgi:hypothetical protein